MPAQLLCWLSGCETDWMVSLATFLNEKNWHAIKHNLFCWDKPGFGISKCANNSPSTIYPLTRWPTRSLLSTGKCIRMKPIWIGSRVNTNLCKGLQGQALALINKMPLARGRWPWVYCQRRTSQGCLSLYWRPSVVKCGCNSKEDTQMQWLILLQ